jgi:hypothetical protein
MNYENDLKQPFYRVRISDPTLKRTTSLTPELERLITSVKITQAIESTVQGPSMLTMELREHVFLPENSAKLGQAVGWGQVPNRPANLLDLRFDSEQGYTFVSTEELRNNYTSPSRTKSGKSEPIIFLFQTNNYIEIEWGYLEPFISKKVLFRIASVQAKGSSGGEGNITVQATSDYTQLKRTVLSNGVSFTEPDGTATSLKRLLFKLTQILPNSTDLIFNTEPVLRLPPQELNKNSLLQSGVDTALHDPKVPEVILANQSVEDFLSQLARKYSCVWEFGTNATTFKQELRFSSIPIRYNQIEFDFTFSSYNNIVLSYSVNDVSGSVNPAASANSLDNSSNAYISTQVATKNSSQKSTSEAQGTDVKTGTDSINMSVAKPMVDEDISKAEKVLGTKVVGSSTTHPGNRDAVEAQASSTNQRNYYPITISVSTIGYPLFQPALVKMNNIGVRFSATYQMFTVTHNLNSRGYTCDWAGKTKDVSEGGVTPDSLVKENLTIDTQVATT